MTMAGLLTLASIDDDVGAQRLGPAIERFPGWGSKTTPRLLSRLGLDRTVTLKRLASWPHRKLEVIAAIDHPDAVRVELPAAVPFFADQVTVSIRAMGHTR